MLSRLATVFLAFVLLWSGCVALGTPWPVDLGPDTTEAAATPAQVLADAAADLPDPLPLPVAREAPRHAADHPPLLAPSRLPAPWLAGLQRPPSAASRLPA